ncbi:MAG: rhodanese-like domain-containing protein [Polyangiaceae bacterium]
MRSFRGAALGIGVLVLGSAAVGALGCSGKSGSSSATSSEGQMSGKEAVAKAALVIDVRTPEEFGTGHLDKAENIPVDDVQAKVEDIAQKVGGDKSKPIAVYCASGGRASRAKEILQKAGFTNVTNAGGYSSLK